MAGVTDCAEVFCTLKLGERVRVRLSDDGMHEYVGYYGFGPCSQRAFDSRMDPVLPAGSCGGHLALWSQPCLWLVRCAALVPGIALKTICLLRPRLGLARRIVGGGGFFRADCVAAQSHAISSILAGSPPLVSPLPEHRAQEHALRESTEVRA